MPQGLTGQLQAAVDKLQTPDRARPRPGNDAKADKLERSWTAARRCWPGAEGPAGVRRLTVRPPRTRGPASAGCGASPRARRLASGLRAEVTR